VTKRIGPGLTLILAAPLIAEVLPGFTRLTAVPFSLLPEIGVWGCGALLIRALVRSRRRAWTALLLLGLALAVAEECVIQQTSLAPMAGLARQDYGRLLGVNWVYLLWALGYESTWVVMVPVQLTELVFPDRRAAIWPGRRGLVAAAVGFLFGSAVAWFSWTGYARTEVFHMAPYQVPAWQILVAMGVIAMLVAVAANLPSPQERPRPGQAPPVWLAGMAALAMALPWFVLVTLALEGWPSASVPAGLALVVGLTWAATALWLVCRWAGSQGWHDGHRLALVAGAIVASMIAGFVTFAVGGALPVDVAGKVIVDIAALLLLGRLTRQVMSRPAGQAQAAVS
jgi:hypothetical protein